MLLSYTLGLIAVFLWALIPLLLKAGLSEISITYFLVLRFFFSSLVFLPFLKSTLVQVKRVPRSLLLTLLICIGLNYLLQSLAIKDLPVSAYILIFSLNPILAMFFMGVRLTKNLCFSIALAFVGVFLFLSNQNEPSTSQVTLFSYLYLAGGMLTWVFYTLIAKRLQNYMNDLELTATTNYTSLVASVILWTLAGLPTNNLSQLSSMSWAALILASIGMPAAYYCYLYCLRRLPIFSQLSQYLELIFGLIFAVLFANEDMTPTKLCGALFILSTLVLSSRDEHKSGALCA